MSLRVTPVQSVDFDVLIGHASQYEPGDDLVAPPNPLSWPVHTRAEAEQRARCCFAMQQRRFLEDPTVHFMKVVNEGGEIVAVARWHYYEDGYSYEKEAHWEMATNDESKDRAASYKGNVALHNHILTARDSYREQWLPLKAPCWLLMHLVTRPSQRGRGAARQLIQWGQAQAQDTGAPMYLEAGVQGQPVYERFGFKQVGAPRTVSLEGLGGPEGVSEFRLVNMWWHPRENVAED